MLPSASVSTSFTVGSGDSVLLIADISRIQHASPNINTAFRIIVDDTDVVATANTGNSYTFGYADVSLVGVASGLSVGLHTAKLEVTRPVHTHYSPHH